MARLAPWALLLLLAGCASPPTGDSQMPLDVYVFEDPGAHAFWDVHGVMMRITNPTGGGVEYEVAAPNMTQGRFGPVDRDGWQTTIRYDTLQPGHSRLWLFEFEETRTMHVFEVEVRAAGGVHAWQQHLVNAGGPARVEPGMHVLSYTAGVWINGTSFYTNVAAFNDDPAFPAGYDRAAFGGAPLPVYVYDQDRSEQPPRSIDTCHATTIAGYNALLKTQGIWGTGVRFLAPEEGYTRPGNEDHFLYGQPLVFLNRVAAHEPRDERLDNVPDPQGACFDVDRYTPDPVPDITAVPHAARFV